MKLVGHFLGGFSIFCGFSIFWRFFNKQAAKLAFVVI